MDPKKSFGPLKVLKKLIFGPQKMEKIDFLQNLDLPDLAEHGRGLPQYPATSSHSDLDSSNFLEPKQYQTIFWGQSLGQYKTKQYKMDQI